jgi:hypothetical protein
MRSGSWWRRGARNGTARGQFPRGARDRFPECLPTDGTDCRLLKVTSVRHLLAAVGSKTPACLMASLCDQYFSSVQALKGYMTGCHFERGRGIEACRQRADRTALFDSAMSRERQALLPAAGTKIINVPTAAAHTLLPRWVIHDRCIQYPCRSMSVVTSRLNWSTQHWGPAGNK